MMKELSLVFCGCALAGSLAWFILAERGVEPEPPSSSVHDLENAMRELAGRCDGTESEWSCILCPD